MLLPLSLPLSFFPSLYLSFPPFLSLSFPPFLLISLLLSLHACFPSRSLADDEMGQRSTIQRLYGLVVNERLRVRGSMDWSVLDGFELTAEWTGRYSTGSCFLPGGVLRGTGP